MNQDKIINGKKLAAPREQKLLAKLEKLEEKPRVVSILIGDDPASLLYTEIKQKKAKELGIDFKPSYFPASVNYVNTLQLIKALNRTSGVDGVMVQLPLPKEFLRMHQPHELLNAIDPGKDIDGLSVQSKFLPAAVKAVLSILEDEKVVVKGKKVVVVGISDLVGKPLARELEKMGSGVTSCNSKTEDLKKETLQGDILISATGVPGIIKGDMVKEGAVVIDVGISEVDGKIKGDIDFDGVLPKVSKITPVPGGVGPMTVISLMENVVECMERKS